MPRGSGLAVLGSETVEGSKNGVKKVTATKLTVGTSIHGQVCENPPELTPSSIDCTKRTLSGRTDLINRIVPAKGSRPKHGVTLSYTKYVGIVRRVCGNSVWEPSPRVARAERRCAGVGSLTRGN